MSITGPGSITATTLAAQNNLFSQLDSSASELGTGQASQTYSGLGSQAGVAVSLSAQLSAINSYATTGTALGTTLTLSQSVLTQIGSSSTAVQQAISQQGQFSLDNTGQTATQKTAASYLDQILAAQHPGRKRLHFFRQRHRSAVGGCNRASFSTAAVRRPVLSR